MISMQVNLACDVSGDTTPTLDVLRELFTKAIRFLEHDELVHRLVKGQKALIDISRGQFVTRLPCFIRREPQRSL